MARLTLSHTKPCPARWLLTKRLDGLLLRRFDITLPTTHTPTPHAVYSYTSTHVHIHDTLLPILPRSAPAAGNASARQQPPTQHHTPRKRAWSHGDAASVQLGRRRHAADHMVVALDARRAPPGSYFFSAIDRPGKSRLGEPWMATVKGAQTRAARTGCPVACAIRHWADGERWNHFPDEMRCY